MFEGNLEAKFPQRRVGRAGTGALTVAASRNAAGEGGTSNNVQQKDKVSIGCTNQAETEEVHVET